MTGILQILVPGILVVLSLGALRSASWAVTLLILMYALEQSLQGASPIFRSTPLLTNAWVGVVALLSSMRSIFRIERPFAGYLTVSLLLTITIFIWAIASLVWTPARQTAMQMTQSGVPTTALFVIFGVLLVSSIDELGSVARLLLVFGTAVAVSILVNTEFTIVNGRLGINLGYMVRSSALAIGELGGLLVIVAALYRSERLEPLITVMRIVAFAAGTVLGLYSGSRGQLAFAAIVAVGFFPLTQRVKSVFSFFATAIGLIVVAVSLLLLVRLVFRAEGGMIESRWDGATIERGLGVRIANSLDLFLAFANTP